MPNEGTIDVKHTGVVTSNRAKAETQSIILNIPRDREALLQKETRKASLSLEDEQKLRKAEAAGKIFLRTKVERFVPQTQFILDLPPVNYIQPSFGNLVQGFYIPTEQIIASVVNPEAGDLLNSALVAFHELDHAIGKRQLWIHWKDPNTPDRKGEFAGLVVPTTSLERRAEGIDNAIVILDQVEFAGSLKDIFPEEIQKRRQTLEREEIRNFLLTMSVSQFGPVEKDNLVTFLGVPRNSDRITIDTLGVNYFRFGQELCFIIGQKLALESGRESLTREKMIELGRNLLIQERLPGREWPKSAAHPALQKIVEIFGGENAKKLFLIDDQGNGLDEGMDILKQKQKEINARKLS